MNEDSIVQKLRKHSRLIGDDCAIMSSRASEDLLFTTDFSIENVHFTREARPEHIGYRALARSFSDIAAMGGTPRFCLVSLALAAWADDKWIAAFYRGLLNLANNQAKRPAGFPKGRAIWGGIPDFKLPPWGAFWSLKGV